MPRTIGVAAYCGFGREAPTTMPNVLKDHLTARELCTHRQSTPLESELDKRHVHREFGSDKDDQEHTSRSQHHHQGR